MMRIFILWSCAVVFGAEGAGLTERFVFTGMCDASAAVAVNADLFAVANDEDNLLRFYRLSRPGKPVHIFNLNPLLFAKKKSPEMDLEGVARLGQRTFWITSHGRNPDGELASNRHRLFALELNCRGEDISVQLVGRTYTNLIADLSRESRFAPFRLAEASKLAPEARGGLGIEALTDTPEGALLIGFRNPIPEGRALLVPLLNPNELLTGQAPKFGDPLLLDLGGLGLRGMGSTGAGYYLLAGPADGDADCRLFFWQGGASVPRPFPGVTFAGIKPEGICFPDVSNRSEFLVLSDDGGRKLNGKDCKSLPESQRQFRAFRVSQ